MRHTTHAVVFAAFVVAKYKMLSIFMFKHYTGNIAFHLLDIETQ